MGGSIPPVLWDGAGNAIVNDDVGVLSLNLPDVSTPQSEAKPSPADLKGEAPAPLDRKSVVEGKSVSVRVDHGGRRIIKQKIIQQKNQIHTLYTNIFTTYQNTKYQQ